MTMKSKPASKLSNVLDFLFIEDSSDLIRELENAGVDLKKIDQGVGDVLAKAERTLKRQKLIDAREERVRFERETTDEINDLFESLPKDELIHSILSGKLGSEILMQFRNRSVTDLRGLTEDELRSILRDQHLLSELLKKKSEKK